MLTMAQRGISWDDKDLLAQVILVTHDNWDRFSDELEAQLAAQEASWAGTYNWKEMQTTIYNGAFQAWLLYTKEGCQGLMLTAIKTYPTYRSLSIEFLSCRKFYQMLTMEPILEKRAMQLGASYIEAVADPTLAEYAVVKRGYTTPGVFIRKDLRIGRRH